MKITGLTTAVVGDFFLKSSWCLGCSWNKDHCCTVSW